MPNGTDGSSVGLKRHIYFVAFTPSVLQTTQAAVQPRARSIQVQELPRHRNSLLSRRQGHLQPTRRVTAVRSAVALAPFLDSLRCNPKPFRKNSACIVAGLNVGPDFWERHSLLLKIDQHGRTTPRMPLSTGFSVNIREPIHPDLTALPYG